MCGYIGILFHAIKRIKLSLTGEKKYYIYKKCLPFGTGTVIGLTTCWQQFHSHLNGT